MTGTIRPDSRDRNLARYLQEIRSLPMLTAEQELALATRYCERGDVDAAHTLVTSHLRLVAKIATHYSGYGLPLNDLVAEGNIGMMRAVERFDPTRGWRLATYAMWWIRGAIQEYILHNWSLVRMGTTPARKRLFFNLRKLKHQIQVIEDGDLTPEAVRRIAIALDVPDAEVVSMNAWLAGPDHSLNAPLSEDDHGEWQDRLVDEREDHETEICRRDELHQRSRCLDRAFHALNERERHILRERHLRDSPATLADLSRRHNISRERVRQIEGRALEKLRTVMKTVGPNRDDRKGRLAALPAGCHGAHAAR